MGCRLVYLLTVFILIMQAVHGSRPVMSSLYNPETLAKSATLYPGLDNNYMVMVMSFTFLDESLPGRLLRLSNDRLPQYHDRQKSWTVGYHNYSVCVPAPVSLSPSPSVSLRLSVCLSVRLSLCPSICQCLSLSVSVCLCCLCLVSLSIGLFNTRPSKLVVEDTTLDARSCAMQQHFKTESSICSRTPKRTKTIFCLIRAIYGILVFHFWGVLKQIVGDFSAFLWTDAQFTPDGDTKFRLFPHCPRCLEVGLFFKHLAQNVTGIPRETF